jgi:hypothetical protein
MHFAGSTGPKKAMQGTLKVAARCCAAESLQITRSTSPTNAANSVKFVFPATFVMRSGGDAAEPGRSVPAPPETRPGSGDSAAPCTGGGIVPARSSPVARSCSRRHSRVRSKCSAFLPHDPSRTRWAYLQEFAAQMLLAWSPGERRARASEPHRLADHRVLLDQVSRRTWRGESPGDRFPSTSYRHATRGIRRHTGRATRPGRRPPAG